MTLVLFWIGFIGLFFAIMNALPVATPLSSDFTNAFTTIVSNMKAWDTLFPITELLTAVGFVMSFYIFKFGWKAVKWTIHVVRGGGTS